MEIEIGRLWFFLAAMEYLWKKNFRNISRVIKTKSEELFVADNSQVYFLTEWMPGKHIDFSQKSQLDIGIRLLADFHKKSEGFMPPKGCLPKNNIGEWPKKWGQRIKELRIMKELAIRDKDNFDLVFLSLADMALVEANQALIDILAADYQVYCQKLKNIKPLCHRDFVDHNIVYDGGHAFLIDFEYCVQDSRLVDLARFIRTTVVNYPWEKETVKSILTGYQKEYPLTPVEGKLLIALLMFPHDIWRLGHKWYFSGNRKKSLYRLLCRQYQFYHQKYQVLKKIKREVFSL